MRIVSSVAVLLVLIAFPAVHAAATDNYFTPPPSTGDSRALTAEGRSSYPSASPAESGCQPDASARVIVNGAVVPAPDAKVSSVPIGAGWCGGAYNDREGTNFSSR